MIRQLPLIPTILVVAAAGVMVWLGFWQLGRADEKAALIAEFETALADEERITFSGFDEDEALYSRAMFLCEEVIAISQRAGRNARGQSGYAQIATCETGGAKSYEPIELTDYVIERVDVSLGWSGVPTPVEWAGGEVIGRVAPPGEEYGRVVADPPLVGLQPLAKPDPNDLPNNHLAYAGQWFFFALTALVIYFFAVRSRLAKRD